MLFDTGPLINGQMTAKPLLLKVSLHKVIAVNDDTYLKLPGISNQNKTIEYFQIAPLIGASQLTKGTFSNPEDVPTLYTIFDFDFLQRVDIQYQHTPETILISFGGFSYLLLFVFALLSPLWALNFLHHLASIVKEKNQEDKRVEIANYMM